MAKIKVLAVEDDELYAHMLRMVMDQLGYELIEVVSDPAEAMKLLHATKPDVLLMDIDLGGDVNGIELVKNINETKDVPVIYVTTYRDIEMMGKAMATHPEGYITKPYDAAQLQAAIELAVLRKQKELSPAKSALVSAPSLKAVFVKEGAGLVKLLLQDIALVEAYDKYCYVYTKEKKRLLSVPLKSLLQQLPQDRFLQVHRSYVVNLEAIEKIKPQQNSLEVIGRQVPVSKSFKAALYAHLTTI